MADATAQNLIAEIVTLHEQLCQHLAHQVELAGLGPAEPSAGRITGTGDRDQMLDRAQAIQRAEREQQRVLKNARQMLRRTIEWYQVPLGQRRPARAPVESIDYQQGGTRRVG